MEEELEALYFKWLKEADKLQEEIYAINDHYDSAVYAERKSQLESCMDDISQILYKESKK